MGLDGRGWAFFGEKGVELAKDGVGFLNRRFAGHGRR